MNEFESGKAFPARKAGFALLAVAAVAAIAGVVALLTGDDEPLSSQQAAVSSQLEQTTQAATATITSSPTITAAPASTTNSVIPSVAPSSSPGSTTGVPTPQSQNGQAQAVQKSSLRIYNNSTISGLANRASTDVEKLGWSVAEVGNYAGGNIPTTTVYYRPGTDEETSAKQLAQSLRARAEPRFAGIANAHSGVIIIVTNDYQGPAKT